MDRHRRPGRGLRGRAEVRHGTPAVRPAAGRPSSWSRRSSARMLGNVTASLVPGGAADRAAGPRASTGTRTRPWPRCQTSLLMRETVALAREVVRRQRHHAGRRRRAFPCRRRGRLFLRGHPRDQRPDRRPRPHRRQRLHPLTEPALQPPSFTHQQQSQEAKMPNLVVDFDNLPTLVRHRPRLHRLPRDHPGPDQHVRRRHR